MGVRLEPVKSIVFMERIQATDRPRSMRG